jgi:hypothetical protein
MPSKPAIPGSNPGGRTILAREDVLTHVDIQFVCGLEAVRCWIACLRLFSQVLLMFKPNSLAFW